VKPARDRSRLGRFTLSLTLLAIGVLALIHIVGSVYLPFGAYVAVALAAVGLGLMIGAWYGRSRSLVVFGVILSVILLANSAVGDLGSLRGSPEVTWAPASMAELSDQYRHNVGNAELDLTRLTFDGLDKHVSAEVNAGNLHVTVPPKVDVLVHAKVNFGTANVFDAHWTGVNTPQRTVTDNDTDGPGPGHLTLDLRVKAGNLEVTR
jgi:hypothetical protein